MKWVLLGQRHASILESNLSVLSWSKGLRSEIGVGYSQSIVNNQGKMFVPWNEKEEIYSLVQEDPIKFIDNLYLNAKKISQLLKQKSTTNYLKIFNLWIKDYTYFYIAKVGSEEYFQKKATASEKLKIEKWRSDEDLYSVEWLAIRRLSKQFKIPVKIIENCTLDELKKIVNSQQIVLQTIKTRLNKPWSLIQTGSSIKLVLEDLDPTKKQNFKNVKTIKGKVAFGVKEIIKGIVGKDILVEIMTKPNMVPQMRKMKSVITDEGGVLCHAAIAAREFKIPTIVGTKIASRILKAGDAVEVDTIKGIIQILS